MTAHERAADDVFSTWKPESPLSRLRRGEITLDEAPPEVAEVLELCRQARDASDGWFDPWRLPGGVDPTGLVKGWAARARARRVQAAGVPAAMINAGGDIAVYGEPEPGTAVAHRRPRPAAADRLLCVVEIAGAGAVATSGTYERGEHLRGPVHRGARQRSSLSATVIGPDLTFADALATAVFVSGGKALDAHRPLRRLQRVRGRRATAPFGRREAFVTPWSWSASSSPDAVAAAPSLLPRCPLRAPRRRFPRGYHP